MPKSDGRGVGVEEAIRKLSHPGVWHYGTLLVLFGLVPGCCDFVGLLEKLASHSYCYWDVKRLTCVLDKTLYMYVVYVVCVCVCIYDMCVCFLFISF